MLMQTKLKYASQLARRIEDHLRADDEEAAREDLRRLRDRLMEVVQQYEALAARLYPVARVPRPLAELAKSTEPGPAFTNSKRRRFTAPDDLR
ncbi:hypothetical protein [Geminicoccus harenae]|uniref:hypothetical protein n=1 Tax=Geminicoccus harenae TaxID=2498453 RepID=UPI00168BBDC2|nr:hypothetical protein [Geminicoccus harenae]